MNDLWYENGELRDKLSNIQARTMRHNLIFTEIPEVYREEENTENIVKTVIRDKVQIGDQIDFENVHRFKRRFGNRPRKIVAQFHRFKQRELVRKNARNLAGTGIKKDTISFIPDNRFERRESGRYSDREHGQYDRSLKRQRVHSSDIQNEVSYAAAVVNGSPKLEQNDSER
ncbi:hypothetical protein KUTeg_003926 [Tegillarca granosa]|uniref:Uncharacterized protein n=1 Tax=Tegillarca granosa TaxID=220873 RepID=A0ABQ9FRC4_TEGGR|nr:hypothetical protein KUTeg_003926 [Tegillarca granosa]